MKKKTIVLLEEYSLVRETMVEAINFNSYLEVVASTGNEQEALEFIAALLPDIVLLDISLTSLSGFDIIQTIRSLSQKSRIVVLSRHSRVEYAKQTMKLGAVAFVTKTSTLAEMVNAIDLALQGSTYLCRDIKDVLADEIMDAPPAVSMLTSKELEIIRYVVDGYSSEEIAWRVDVSKSTVNAHRRNILRKLEIKNSAEMVQFAWTHGLNQSV